MEQRQRFITNRCEFFLQIFQFSFSSSSILEQDNKDADKDIFGRKKKKEEKNDE